MPDRSCGHRGRSARAAPPQDQAAGLRRLFAPSEPHCRFGAGVRALAVTADCALLVLPARHGRTLAGLCPTGGISDAIVVAGPGSVGERTLIETMRSLLSVADIDTFRLLFQGTDP